MVIGAASQATAAAVLERSRFSAHAFFMASPRRSNAALRSPVSATLTASISDGNEACASPTIGRSADWKRWKSW